MTGGELIEARLKQKLCIRCGTRDALKSPYLCDFCQRELESDRQVQRDEGFPRQRQRRART